MSFVKIKQKQHNMDIQPTESQAIHNKDNAHSTNNHKQHGSITGTTPHKNDTKDAQQATKPGKNDQKTSPTSATHPTTQLYTTPLDQTTPTTRSGWAAANSGRKTGNRTFGVGVYIIWSELMGFFWACYLLYYSVL